MKIGVCTSTERLALLCELGFDYIDVHFGWLSSLYSDALREQTALMEKYALPAEAFHLFFRRDMTLYAPDGVHDGILRDIEAYAAAGFARASAWGGRVAVIGNGTLRSVPDTMTREQAERQFARVLSVCGEAADKVGMRVAVEPLSYRESNMIHTVAEGAAMAELSGHSAVGVVVDFYHSANNSDPLESMPCYADKLIHAHYARRGDRYAPETEDREHVEACASVLRKCPNIERISLECSLGDRFEDALRSAVPQLEILRRV